TVSAVVAAWRSMQDGSFSLATNQLHTEYRRKPLQAPARCSGQAADTYTTTGRLEGHRFHCGRDLRPTPRQRTSSIAPRRQVPAMHRYRCLPTTPKLGEPALSQ